MEHFFDCVTFLADGSTVSTIEACASASEAMARASAWRAIGTKAEAYLKVIDLDRLEVYHFPLQ